MNVRKRQAPAMIPMSTGESGKGIGSAVCGVFLRSSRKNDMPATRTLNTSELTKSETRNRRALVSCCVTVKKKPTSVTARMAIHWLSRIQGWRRAMVTALITAITKLRMEIFIEKIASTLVQKGDLD